MAAHPYYTDPRTGYRTTRDAVARLVQRAAARVEKWAEEAERLTVKVERTRSASWAARWMREIQQAQRYRDRAVRDQESAEAALAQGDGRDRDWQYRLSVNYTQRKGKQGDYQRLSVDLIFEAPKKRRASSEEVRRVFRHFFHHGGASEGWHVKAVTWHHATARHRSPRTPAQDQVRTHVAGPDGIADHVQTIFRKVFNAEAGQEDVTEERVAGRRGRTRYVIGEEAR